MYHWYIIELSISATSLIISISCVLCLVQPPLFVPRKISVIVWKSFATCRSRIGRDTIQSHVEIVFPHLAQLVTDSYEQTRDQKRYRRINMPLLIETEEHHIR